jgi:outer membrane protein assembly factor BamB
MKIPYAIPVVLALLFQCSASGDDWNQWLGNNRDGIWKESGILKKFPDGGPKVVWKTEIGSGYAGPAVANGNVFVMDRKVADSATLPKSAFERGEIPGKERVLCLNAADGEVRWEHGYDANYTVSYASGPRVTPTVDGDRVYSLGAEGLLVCLNTADGNPLWQCDLKSTYAKKTPVWGFAGHPLVVDDLLICLAGGDGSIAVAFDKRTGEEKWRALSAKEPGYSPPTLIEHGGRKQVILWHPEAVNSLDPVSGNVLWTIPWQLRSGLSIPTPQLDGDWLFLTCFYNGSLMLQLKPDQTTPEILWQTEKVSESNTTHLNSIMSTPYLKDDHIYGVCSYGEFRCLEAATGRRVWENMTPTTGQGKKERWANVFLTPHGNRFFLFNESGHLIITELSPAGYKEIDRAPLIKPNGIDLKRRPIVWSHPAYAGRRIYLRNDTEIRCISLAE